MSASAPTADSPAPSGWLFGAVPDLALGCGVASIAVILFQAASGGALAGIVPGALLVLAFSLPHYGATLVRAYEQAEDRRRYALFTVYLSILIAALFLVGLRSMLVGSLILTVYLTWSPWHYTGQNYGIFLMLLARRGVDVSPLAKRLVYASFVLSYAMIFTAIHGIEPAGSYAPVSYEGTSYTLLPLGLSSRIADVVLSFLLVGYVATLAGAAFLMRGATLTATAPAWTIAFTQALWFSLPVVLKHWGGHGEGVALKDAYTAYGFLWIAAGHAVQYLWITTYYATASQAKPRRLVFLGKATLAGYAIWMLPAVLFAPSLLGRLPYESGLALLIAAVVNLHHFVLDGAIWKLRDGRVGRVLLRAEPHDADVDALPHRPGWLARSAWALGVLSILYAGLTTYEEQLGFQAALGRGDLRRAELSVDRFARIGRDSADRRLRLGKRLAGAGRYGQALAQFRSSIGLAPSLEAWRSVAAVYIELGDQELAIRALVSALALDSDDAEAHYRIGLTLLRLGRPSLALKSLERASELVPDQRNVAAALRRARLQQRTGRSAAGSSSP